MKRVILPVLLATLLVLALGPQLFAQSCSGNADVAGAYGFAGSRSVFVTAATPSTTGNGSTGSGSTTGTTGAGSTTTTPTFSSTPIGQFFSALTGVSPFSVVSRILADGEGNFFALAPNGNSQTKIGTYNINKNCTITATFTDAFLPTTTTTGNSNGNTGNTTTTTVTQATATFQGIVLGRGAEIDLAQSDKVSNGGVITLRKTLYYSGCSNATLQGGFGFATVTNLFGSAIPTTGNGNNNGNNGTGTTTSTTMVPSPLFTRLFTNGDGTLGFDPAIASDQQINGTYTVNADCTGTAHFTLPNGTVRDINFTIVQPLGGACQNQSAVRPELLFGFTNTGVNGFGFARQE